ncbi:MAG: LSU ribosomal protein L33p @ LSU ribosomal protein L33p, zinc-dependent, partial [uncultured Pseudonocardia sp.]
GQGHRRPAEDHAGVRAVQAPELHHQEEPAQRPRPARDQEVLLQLRHAPRAPRDPL